MTINVNDLILPLAIGKRGENAAEEITFDFTPWYEKYGDGTLVLLIQRHGEKVIYPVELTQNGPMATWTVSATDTAIKGIGKASLQYTVGDVIKKGRTFRFNVEDSLTPSGTAPEPYSNYVEQVLEAEQSAEASAEAAAQSAEEAAQYRPRIIDGLIYL